MSSLIELINKSKDPASVGLRKILKKKEDQSKDYNLHAPPMKEFDDPGNHSKKKITEEESIIISLEKKVQELQEKLDQQCKSIIEKEKLAYNKGHEEGLSEGILIAKTEVTGEYEKKINSLQKISSEFLTNLEKEKKQIYANAEHLLLKLCFEIVKKITSCEIKENDEIILSVIRKAISYIGDREHLVIRVSPSDFEKVSGRKDYWAPITDRLQEIIIEKDDRIEQGGCIVESNSGIVDGRLGVQIEELSMLIEKVWESETAGI
jgi:flagellar assembly protein FliH